MKAALAHYLHKYAPFSTNEIDQIYQSLTIKKLLKGDYLLQEGQVCQHQFFLYQGLTRSYYINQKGIDQIVQFAIENWWVTDMESFILETPSLVSIQTLEKCTVLCLHKEDLERLYRTLPKLERVFRVISERMLIALQRRNEFFMKAPSEEKYLNIVQKIPNLINRVPQYMIASYLDMTPEHLSAIRKKVSQEN